MAPTTLSHLRRIFVTSSSHLRLGPAGELCRRAMASDATEDISSVATEEMSSVATEEMSSDEMSDKLGCPEA